MKYIFLGISFFLIFTNQSFAKSCSSDFSCRMGEVCVKEPYKSRGVCMKSVNQYGTRVYNAPSTSSIGTRSSSDGCTFNTDCPIGFKCDRKLKYCVK